MAQSRAPVLNAGALQSAAPVLIEEEARASPQPTLIALNT
jgi:hypothetical protein